MLFQATLTKITDFKQLIFQISEDTYNTLQGKIDSRNTWMFETEEDEERFYAKVLLDRFDKAVIERKFDPLVKKVCMVTANIDKFTPPDSDTELTFLRLKKIFALKQQPVLRRRRAQLSAEMEAAADEGHDEAHRVKVTDEEEAIADALLATTLAPPKLVRQNAYGASPAADEDNEARE